jgi:hypothetical protein
MSGMWVIIAVLMIGLAAISFGVKPNSWRAPDSVAGKVRH